MLMTLQNSVQINLTKINVKNQFLINQNTEHNFWTAEKSQQSDG